MSKVKRMGDVVYKPNKVVVQSLSYLCFPIFLCRSLFIKSSCSFFDLVISVHGL